ncbi:MAG: hypothetical protein ACE5JL_11910 [Dehalococcoidia bacterium]
MAGNRLLLLDVRGEIAEGDLMAFMEEFVEPRLWSWLAKLKEGQKAIFVAEGEGS